MTELKWRLNMSSLAHIHISVHQQEQCTSKLLPTNKEQASESELVNTSKPLNKHCSFGDPQTSLPQVTPAPVLSWTSPTFPGQPGDIGCVPIHSMHATCLERRNLRSLMLLHCGKYCPNSPEVRACSKGNFKMLFFLNFLAKFEYALLVDFAYLYILQCFAFSSCSFIYF